MVEYGELLPLWFMHLTGPLVDEKEHQGKASRVEKCVKRQAEQEDEVEEKEMMVEGILRNRSAINQAFVVSFYSLVK